jgi:8-amino-7-oxononanoate synthase
LERGLQPRSADDTMVDLAGNDYLGLSREPAVVEAATAALVRYGLGATGSRLVRGSTVEHATLERELADLMGRRAALVYSSGYLANLGVVRALARPGSVFVLDAHAHASLVDGCRSSGARTVPVAHNDVDALAAVLADLPSGLAVVVTESVFSVDGDAAPLARLHQVCRDHKALLLVDDAHALGVVGPFGGGAVAAAGLAEADDVIVTATLSKSLGCAGGMVAGSDVFIRHLVQTSRTFIYDTALPPAVMCGAQAALMLMKNDTWRRDLVRQRAAALAEALQAAGLGVTSPAAGIVSVFAPSAIAALEWSRACQRAGIAVGCFRPPTTPDHRSRLRLTINAAIPAADFERAVKVIIGTAPSPDE